jgi:hypothetical protein
MEYLGHGYTLKARDTILKEYMRLYKGSLWTLEVTGVNDTAVHFKSSRMDSTSFTVENPEHDFPTKIQYRIQNDTLKATVSNNETQVDFSFVKQ